ncbi:MAG: hypothetical protein A2138_03535 [Deltaproteobacteria bacterium RBG_16_71_12]|nr:MAG: hypothetical protein A2138_03535 [Deltaproteobacteria bacterium RBG_16_71_12]
MHALGLFLALAARAPAGTPDPEGVLTLDAVLTRALEEAPPVTSAKAQANVVRSRIDIADAASLPSLDGVLSTSALASNGLSLLSTSAQCSAADFASSAAAACGEGVRANGDVGVSLEARWLIFDFGRTAESVRSALLSANAADADVHSTSLQAAVAAGTSFLALSGGLALVDARKQIVDERQRLLEVAHGRVAAGAASPIEETRAQVSLETAKVDVRTAEAAAADAAASLAIALGMDPTKPVHIEPPEALHVDAEPAHAADLAEQRRPELASWRLRVAAAAAALASARAARHPSLAATASAGAELNGDVTPGATLGEGARIGASFTIPIFEPQTSAAIASAEAQSQVVQAHYRQAALAIRGEAARAATAVLSFSAALAAAEQLQEQADDNYRQAVGRYQAGAAGSLELIDAEAQQSAAVLSVIDARFRLEGAKLRLMAATGSLPR